MLSRLSHDILHSLQIPSGNILPLSLRLREISLALRLRRFAIRSTALLCICIYYVLQFHHRHKRIFTIQQRTASVLIIVCSKFLYYLLTCATTFMLNAKNLKYFLI